MTKDEYQLYIRSEHWLELRKTAIESAEHRCQRCGLPRWVAGLLYSQDLNVHHRNYERLGSELPGDLEVLCRRCHEIETFGRSDFQRIKTATCLICGEAHFNVFSDVCERCFESDVRHLNWEEVIYDAIWACKVPAAEIVQFAVHEGQSATAYFVLLKANER